MSEPIIITDSGDVPLSNASSPFAAFATLVNGTFANGTAFTEETFASSAAFPGDTFFSGTFANGTFFNGTFSNGTFFNGTDSHAAAAVPPLKQPFWFPFVYMGFLFVAFGMVVRWNNRRMRKDLTEAAEDTYFGPHVTAMRYTELTEQYSPEDPFGRRLLCIALIKRAVEDVRRIWKLQSEKAPMQNLLRQGALSEDLWDKILLAEKQLDAEVQDLLVEAELYRTGWKDTILSEAAGLAKNQMRLEAEAEAQESETDTPLLSPASATSSGAAPLSAASPTRIASPGASAAPKKALRSAAAAANAAAARPSALPKAAQGAPKVATKPAAAAAAAKRGPHSAASVGSAASSAASSAPPSPSSSRPGSPAASGSPSMSGRPSTAESDSDRMRREALETELMGAPLSPSGARSSARPGSGGKKGGARKRK